MNTAPESIDDNTQVFNNRKYTRFGRYFRGRKNFLHRDVWEHHHGPIPPGHHIHHIDHDGSNNRVENLVPVEAFKHLSDHQRGHGRRPVAALAAVVEWRKTAAGKEFHRRMGLQNAHYMQRRRELTCRSCEARFVGRPPAHFCCNACKSAWRRAAGLDNVDRNCVACGATFSVSKYSDTRCCSRRCGTLSWRAA